MLPARTIPQLPQKKNEKKLDILAQPCYNIRIESGRVNAAQDELISKLIQKRLDILLKTLYNESVDVFK